MRDFGRRVIVGTNSSRPGSTTANRNRFSTCARIRVATSRANWLPMHVRGPPPNGKYAKRGIDLEAAPPQRSGSKTSGRSK